VYEVGWTPEPVWMKWRRENSWLCWDLNSDPSPVQLVGNHYTNCTIPAPLFSSLNQNLIMLKIIVKPTNIRFQEILFCDSWNVTYRQFDRWAQWNYQTHFIFVANVPKAITVCSEYIFHIYETLSNMPYSRYVLIISSWLQKGNKRNQADKYKTNLQLWS
jgi:hypothetical protein